ncbi:MBL fold metallo-hydrolase [Patescibacteria group bacterium]|nr:MBL fold metallo-hydrolase [Patescibacteria group bacterium]
MIITYFGLTCFRIQNSGTSILIDRFDKTAGLELPRMQNDIVLESRSNKPVRDDAFAVTGPGEYEVKDIFIYGIPASGDQDNGTMFLIKQEGISLLHLGQTKQFKMSEEQKKMLEEVDILMVPVGGGDSLTAKQAAEAVNELEPRIVIPMYYELPKLKLKLDGLDKFKKEIAAKWEKVDKLKINKKDLPQEETKIIIIEPS